MVKKALVIGAVLFGAWSCAIVPPSAPAFHVEDVPQAVAGRLDLDQRIAADEAWADLKANRPVQAQKVIGRMGIGSSVYAAGLGYVHLLLGDTASAEHDFKEALRTSPDMTPAYAGLAQIYESRGDSENALAQYREILKTEPDNRWAKPRFESLRNGLVDKLSSEAKAAQSAGNLEEAKKAYLRVLFYDPQSAQANIELARIYEKEKNVSGALRHLKSALESQPKNKALLREYADMLFDAGELGPSLDAYESLAELDPQNKAVGQRIDDLKNKLGVYDVPSQYKSIADEEAVTREDLAALIAVKFTDVFSVPGRRTEIMVDIASSWAQKFIIKVVSLDVMSAYDNHTFQPKKIINRAEVAEAVDRLIDFLKGRGSKIVPLVETRRIKIDDVAPDNVYYQPILHVVAYQVMDLTPQKMFEPERTVSGKEAARVLDLVLRLAK